MPDRVLTLHDHGADVIDAQELLNRNGAILDPDGDFGSGTEQAVRELQAAAGLPVSGVIDAATWQQLRALPEPSPDIPTRAVAFIGREEVGSRRFYDTRCARPTWPGGASGVTIGVGYDLGYQAGFEADWSDLLAPADLSALRRWLGRKGDAAAGGPAQLTGIAIPWHAAWMVFIRRSLPQEIVATRATFSGPAPMPPLCLGMLVSLVYNRGTAMADTPGHPGSRKEMRDIRAAIAAGRLVDVPAALRAMKRLWPEGNGLRDRREREATLFEEGLGRG
jgi:GH24 family phage-related lysozyme (muramidase)